MMDKNDRTLTEMIPQPARKALHAIARALLPILALIAGGVGVLFASVRMEYDLKYEDIASPVQHYLALLSFTMVPVAMLLTGLSKTRMAMMLMLVVLVVLIVFAMADWQQGIVVLPAYLVGLFILTRRLRKPV